VSPDATRPDHRAGRPAGARPGAAADPLAGLLRHFCRSADPLVRQWGHDLSRSRDRAGSNPPSSEGHDHDPR
jgi:hypothetical protein